MKWGASNKFEKLRQVSRLHQIWATYMIVGPDSIAKSEYAELKDAGLTDVAPLCLPMKHYLLGKKEAQTRPSVRKALDIKLEGYSSLTSGDFIAIRKHEDRISSIVKALIGTELDAQANPNSDSKVDLRTLVVGCLDELKVVKNSAYIASIVNKEGVFHKSLGADSAVLSTESIREVRRVKDLPERNLYELIFITEDMAKSISSTKKPQGPDGSNAEPAKPGSIPGVAAPDNEPGPGRPPNVLEDGQEEVIRCPYGGGEDCINAGGNGAKEHKTDGVIMKRHAEAMAAGDAPPSEEGQKELVQQEIRDSVNYDKLSHPHSKILADLNTGDIQNMRNISSDANSADAGIIEAYQVSILGGGMALAKPEPLPPLKVDPSAISAGGGTVPPGRSVGREVASYTISMLHGTTDLVPPTTSRSHEGRPMSMQQWKEEHTTGNAAVGLLVGSSKNLTKSFLSQVPGDSKEIVIRKLKTLIAHTIVTNDNDKNMDSVIIKDDFTSFVSIDGGVSFGNSLDGYNNTVQLDMHNAGMKVIIDQELQTRLSNMSLRDYRTAAKGNIEDWAVGQTFLRNRYLLFLQGIEGILDYEKFRSTWGTADGKTLPMPGMWQGLPDDEFEFRKERGWLPGQLFDSWSKGYLEEAAADPDHTDHGDAKTLQELGVFMGPGFTENPEKYRREGKHVVYEKTIHANMEVPKVIRRDSRRTTSPESK